MKLLFAIYYLLSAISIPAATCTGETPCKACKDCSRCKYCTSGKGSCGTCREQDAAAARKRDAKRPASR